MTTQIRRGDEFLGHPLTRLKSLLQHFTKGTRVPEVLGRLSRVDMPPGLVAAMIGEARDRGLVEMQMPAGAENGPSQWMRPSLTNAGRAVVSASALKRTSKPVAKNVLDNVLENAERIRQDKNAPLEVERLWVFGSYVDPEKDDVGDLDIVVEDRRREGFDWHEPYAIAKHIDSRYPGAVPESVDPLDADEHLFKRMLFGARKHALISRTPLRTLIGLHRPCRLVYDRQRGGIIEPIDYEHHPESRGRSKEIRDRLVMPDLSNLTPEFRVTHAETMSSRWLYGSSGNGLVILSDDQYPDAIPINGKTRDVNGEETYAVIMKSGTDGVDPLVLVVDRKVEFTEMTWSYICRIECVSPVNADVDRTQMNRAADIVGMLHQADMLRLADRRDKSPGFPDIIGEIVFCDRMKSIRNFKEKIYNASARTGITRNNALSPRQAYGLDFCKNIPDSDYCAAPMMFEVDDWKTMAVDLPFTEREYDAWVESASVENLKNGSVSKEIRLPRP